MDIKDRVKSYEPLFNQWLFEELVEIHDQESLIKIKHQAIGVEKTALLKVITLYDQDNNIEFLEKRVEEIKNRLGLQVINESEYLDYEQYLIEDNQGKIIGIDLCLLMVDEVDRLQNINNVSGKLLYELGLKLFDKHEYLEALEYFKKGAEVDNSDCVCIIGYLYERGLGVEQDHYQAFRYYQSATSLGNVVASCNLAYFYELGIGVKQDYQKAFELYEFGARAGFARAICNLGYCYEYGHGTAVDLPRAVNYY